MEIIDKITMRLGLWLIGNRETPREKFNRERAERLGDAHGPLRLAHEEMLVQCAHARYERDEAIKDRKAANELYNAMRDELSAERRMGETLRQNYESTVNDLLAAEKDRDKAIEQRDEAQVACMAKAAEFDELVVTSNHNVDLWVKACKERDALKSDHDRARNEAHELARCLADKDDKLEVYERRYNSLMLRYKLILDKSIKSTNRKTKARKRNGVKK